MTSYKNLESTMQKMSSVQHALSILNWDTSVMMPEGGARQRAKTMGDLRVLLKEIITSSQVDEWIEQSQQESLSDWQKANLRQIIKVRQKMTSVSSDLLTLQAQAHSECEMAWRKLRPENNWSDFLPYLKKVVELAQEEARQRKKNSKMSLYEGMMDLYSTGTSEAQLDVWFGELKTGLKDLLPTILDIQSQQKRVTWDHHFAIDMQKSLSQEAMKVLGFDFQKGRLDVSLHPFCGGTEHDVRITTRYETEDFTESLMGVLHETGHALYEQNLPEDWLGQAVGESVGMGVHESQSLFFEKQVGLSPTFLSLLYNKILMNFQLDPKEPKWNFDNFVRLLHVVEPSYIRTKADEVTYPFHVILRYEIEKGLFDGSVQVEDIPSIWDEKMTEYLGLSTQGRDNEGCMQDIHWTDGSFGYFPYYTFGALLAAQMKFSMKKENTELESQWQQGDLSKTKDWLKKNIWSWGSYYTPIELVKQATGEGLSTSYFLQHIRDRYIQPYL